MSESAALASRWRKKPVEIEAAPVAALIAEAKTNWRALPKWFRDSYEKGNLLLLPASIEILTLEGRMTASTTDWIIRGVKGELYPCKPDIFTATYDPA